MRIVARSGRNLYTYVSNNPVMFVDPSGYCKVKVRPRVISNGEYFDVALELDIDYVRIIDNVLTTAQNKISEVVPENILNTLSDIFNAASFFYETVSEIHDNISGVTKIMLGLGILLEGSGMGPGSSSPALSLVGGETELAIVTDGALVLSGIAVLSGAEGLKGKEYKKISEAAKNVSDYLEKAAEKSGEEKAKKVYEENKENILKGLKDAPVEYRVNPKTGIKEPYLKQYNINDEYKVILRRDVGDFNHGDFNHWNLEVQTKNGNTKYDLHMYLTDDGDLMPFTEKNVYIPTNSPFK
ncbi:MAG: hypothetical protein K6F63_01750 [Lachnospiraceae bacterium]|nr:hypothetical protein [Lachnospiraceae bacterium]